MAHELGLFKKHGIESTISKEASWAAVRDKLVNGELDASHVLYGLIYGVQMGVGGPKKDMNILMNLNHNGQAFTLSRKLYDKGVTDGPSLSNLIKKEKGEYTFAQTFPTGTHAMWIYYWLAAHGIHPLLGLGPEGLGQLLPGLLRTLGSRLAERFERRVCTACSISRCELTPTIFRNLRMLRLNVSWSIAYLLERIFPASALPSSTPHWSNELMCQIVPCVNTLCSYIATSCPSTYGVSLSARIVFVG